VTLNVIVLALVTLSRIIELPFARANTRRLLAAGGHEVAPGHYPLIVALHAAWLVALWWLARDRPVSLPLLGMFALVELGRIWVLLTLGKRWTTRIIVVPGETLVRRGPYKFLNHPNYAVVVAEIALLPLLFGLWRTALIFSLLNAAALTIRIRAENRALSASLPRSAERPGRLAN
jgi:methyltransferase